MAEVNSQKLNLRVDFPCYSTHPATNDSKDLDNPIEVIATHRFDDIRLLKSKPKPLQANLCSFGVDKDTSTVCDKYATSHLWSRKELQKQGKKVKKSGIQVGATLLDSDKNPINKVNPFTYALDILKLLVEGYHVTNIDLDFEWHCEDYKDKLLEILAYIRLIDPNITFTATCYMGKSDLPALKLLKNAFPDLTLNTMAYFDTVSEYKKLIETYKKVFQPNEIFLGVSVKTTPPHIAVALVQLAKEEGLGGVFDWNTAQDVAPAKEGHAPDPSLFPYLQALQEAIEPNEKTEPRISFSQEAPARICTDKIVNQENLEFVQLYKRIWLL